MTYRTYYDIDGTDRSNLGAQVGAQLERVRSRLAHVRRVILVASGKGGVGKSYVTASLAAQLADEGAKKIGVVDADLMSPTIARLLEARGPLQVTKDGVLPAIGTGGVKVVSTDLLLEEGQPLQWSDEPQEARFAWRGAMQASVLREFLADTTWGSLDALIVDAPPGTAVLSDLHELVPALAGAVFVTIPSIESARSVARTMRAAIEEGVPVLGVVENMSGSVCERCSASQPLFHGTAGHDLAEGFGVPLLAQLPFRTSPSQPLASLPTGFLDVVLEIKS